MLHFWFRPDSDPNQEILDVITSSKVKTLIKAELFDVNTGDNVAADKKSLAYTLTFSLLKIN